MRNHLLAFLCIASALLFLLLLLNAKFSPHAQSSRSPLTQLDLSIDSFVQQHDGAGDLWTVISWLGSFPFLLIIVLLCIPLFKRDQVLLIIGAGLLALLLQYLLKLVIASPRPVAALNILTTYAFPSGHSLGAACVYGMLLAMILVASDLASYRVAASIALPLLVLLVGISRIALGVHWTTDVLGGWLLGICVVTGLLLARGTTRPTLEETSRRPRRA